MESRSSQQKLYMELLKVRITFVVTLTTALGYFLFSGRVDSAMLLTLAGIFVLACGSSALNHYQERDVDASMERTHRRPIPSGRITAGRALATALVLCMIGLAALALVSMAAAALGFLALVWYNGVYTPLKKKTAFAVVPGSLIGAIPPAVGWVAAGGHPLDREILTLSFFFFIWQVPHFWLLLLVYGKQYEKAGLPSLTRIFSSSQLRRLTFIWMAATAVSCLLIPFVDPAGPTFPHLFLCAASLWLFSKALAVLKGKSGPSPYGFAFRDINLYALAVMVVLSVGRLFGYSI